MIAISGSAGLGAIVWPRFTLEAIATSGCELRWLSHTASPAAPAPTPAARSKRINASRRLKVVLPLSIFSGTVMPLPFPPIQQDLITARTALTHTGDVNRRTILHRTRLLTRSAAHAFRGIQIRLLDLLENSICFKNFCRAEIDRLGRSRAPLFTDDAIRRHCPRQAAAAIVEGSSQPNRLARAAHIDRPAFFFCSDLPNRARRTHLGTQHAAGLAIANARNQNRRPKAFQTCLRQRWLQ